MNRVSLLVVTADKGNIKMLLEDNKVPTIVLKDRIDDALNTLASTKLGFKKLKYRQVVTMQPDDLIINYLSIIDSQTSIETRQENLSVNTTWVDINTALTGLSASIIKFDLDYLRLQMMNTATIKALYPDTFSLPELKKTYDMLYNINIDRRNFRKKLVSQDIVMATDEHNAYDIGRPAKLYRLINENKLIYFKEDL